MFTDASGKRDRRQVLDNTGVTGEYTSSEGLKGDAVWGTRGRWTMLTGTVDAEPVTIAMLDHPSNPGFPTYWHARGYGLFAANPMGEKVFTNGAKEFNLTIQPGASVVFRHRIVIVSGQATPDAVERLYRDFSDPDPPSGPCESASSAAGTSARRTLARPGKSRVSGVEAIYGSNAERTASLAAEVAAVAYDNLDRFLGHDLDL